MPRSPLATLLALLAGCASTEAWTARELRSAEDTPQSFVTEDGTSPEQGCRTPLLDPRDMTQLRLMRSTAVGSTYRGDYEVPPGRYGVGQSELLRVDCATGVPLGIVAN